MIKVHSLQIDLLSLHTKYRSLYKGKRDSERDSLTVRDGKKGHRGKEVQNPTTLISKDRTSLNLGTLKFYVRLEVSSVTTTISFLINIRRTNIITRSRS